MCFIIIQYYNVSGSLSLCCFKNVDVFHLLNSKSTDQNLYIIIIVASCIDYPFYHAGCTLCQIQSVSVCVVQYLSKKMINVVIVMYQI